MSAPRVVTVEVVSGVEGASLYVGDKNSSYRLSGPKPWGGGKTLHKFTVNVDELIREATAYADRATKGKQ